MGKEIIMAKRNKKVQKELSYIEKLVVKMKILASRKSTGDAKRKVVDSLLRWYVVNHYLTSAQTRLASSLVAKSQVKEVKKVKHYLYAISDGVSIKLGMSSNVQNRLKALQTSNSSQLVVLWKYYAADNSKGAIQAERKLHTACKKYKIRGEWFKYECLDVVRQFNPNRKNSCPKWEYAKLITVDLKRIGGILNFKITRLRRTDITRGMTRLWEVKEPSELHLIEASKLINDGHVVMIDNQ